MPDVETADDLYGLSLADFIAARDRLARRLKRDGLRDEAADVAKLRRPPASSWALNMLARSDPACIEAVLMAATDLRDAIGDESSDLHGAQAHYRETIEAAVAAAASIGEITSDDMRSRIRTNLLAGGVNEDVARQLRTGTLPDDQDAPGFAAMPTIGPNPRRLRLVPQPVEEAPDKNAAKPSAARQRESDERAQAAAEAAEQKRLVEQRRKLERELEQLEQRAARLATEADSAEERAASARQVANRAEAMRAELAERLKRLT